MKSAACFCLACLALALLLIAITQAGLFGFLIWGGCFATAFVLALSACAGRPIPRAETQSRQDPDAASPFRRLAISPPPR